MIRRIRHAVTHSHIRASKAGVGEIVICRNRRTDRLDAHLTAAGRHWLIAGITLAELRHLAAADTADSLASAAANLERARSAAHDPTRPRRPPDVH